jgi:hypothetical protein
LFLAANTVILTLTAAFNTTEWAGNRLHDRTVYYVVPLWMIVLLVWVVDGAPRPLAVAGLGAAFAVALPLFLPFSDYLKDDARLQFNAVATTLWTSVDRAVAEVGVSGRVVLAFWTISLALVTLLLPVSRRYLFPALVFGAFGATAMLSWSNASRVADPWSRALVGQQRTWLDERLSEGGSATLLVVTAPCTRLVDMQGYYLTEFFNSSVRRVAHLGTPPDSLPALSVRVSPRGELLLPSGGRLQADFVLAQPGVRLEGRKVGEGTAARLTLWDVAGEVRIVGVTSGEEYTAAVCGNHH